jgi:hypothetical protein
MVHVAATNTRGQSETELCTPAISDALPFRGGVEDGWVCALLAVPTKSNAAEVAAATVIHCRI